MYITQNMNYVFLNYYRTSIFFFNFVLIKSRFPLHFYSLGPLPVTVIVNTRWMIDSVKIVNSIKV